MDILNTKIKNILNEKTTKIRPENIKNGVTILGITGTYEGGGGQVTQPKDVNFYDYDGTLLHSYTLEEVNALTELPELPTQEGLTCQGWNWNLADIKAMGKEVDIGATYITDDGKTRLYIHIPTDYRRNISICFMQTIANGVEVDWGDGSSIETFGGSGNTPIIPTHNYGKSGDYVITLNPIENCVITLGGRTSSYCVMGKIETQNKVYINMLVAIQVGNNANVSAYAFYYCYSLKYITIPNTISKILTYAFAYCYSLVSIVLPNGLTIMEDYAFQNCYSLKHIVIPNTLTKMGRNIVSNCYTLQSVIMPNSLTSIDVFALSSCVKLKRITLSTALPKIPGSLFYECSSLEEIIIPNSVTSIGSNAFYKCGGVLKYDFSNNTQIPILEGAAFGRNCY